MSILNPNTKYNSFSNFSNNNEVDDSLIISLYLLKHCKLWVWDFDDTLIDTKYYYKSNMDPDVIRARTDTDLSNEIPQWRYFKRLVEYLIQNGKYVAIASFGTYEIIKAYMDRIFGFNQHFFMSNNLIAPTYSERDIRGFRHPPNKNEYIYKIMKTYKINDFKIVVLFDDLPSNIGDAIGVGIIGIQIETPNNGDRQGYGSGGVSYSGGNMFFGPWVMVNFDKKIENDCGKELYLNRTFTGITNKYRNSNSKSKSNSITDRVYSGMSYDNTDFRNGVKESFVPVAFGTGIGDRKITVKPEYRWNKMNVSKPPVWVNGDWAENTLGGRSSSFWDKHHIVKNKVSGESGDSGDSGESGESGTLDNDDKYFYKNIEASKKINTYNGKLNEASNSVMGVIEGFENTERDSDSDHDSDSDGKSNIIIKEKKKLINTNDCEPCKKNEFNAILLTNHVQSGHLILISHS